MVLMSTACLFKAASGLSIQLNGTLSKTFDLREFKWDIHYGSFGLGEVIWVIAGVVIMVTACNFQLRRDYASSKQNSVSQDNWSSIDYPKTPFKTKTAIADLGTRNPLHQIIDLIEKYNAAFSILHHSKTLNSFSEAADRWRKIHMLLSGSLNSRDDIIRKHSDPAKEWLTGIRCPYISSQDFDLIENAVVILSALPVSATPMAMPEIYSNEIHSAEELWDQWIQQGEDFTILRTRSTQLKEIAARAGFRWIAVPSSNTSEKDKNPEGIKQTLSSTCQGLLYRIKKSLGSRSQNEPL